MSSGSHTKLLCKLFLLKSSPFTRPPPVRLQFSRFVFSSPTWRTLVVALCGRTDSLFYGQISERVVPMEEDRVRAELLITSHTLRSCIFKPFR
ncbi:hypothetical protein QQF64_013123 [Cirrhinus molitorella]|uniref:Uncharacterized protein n=1 Tax=Cirrhinus molitorella TaxID=172907 RepID=A0ABR3LQ93_9TELE